MTYDEVVSAIASGLTIKVNVYFKTGEIGKDYFDEFVIQVGDRRKPIPLSAYSSKPQLQFQTTINLSHLRLNELKEFTVDFTNTGSPGLIHLLR